MARGVRTNPPGWVEIVPTVKGARSRWRRALPASQAYLIVYQMGHGPHWRWELHEAVTHRLVANGTARGVEAAQAAADSYALGL
jgi:hypothetical protein